MHKIPFVLWCNAVVLTIGFPLSSDHAQLFIMSTMLWWLDPDGHKVGASALGADPAARAEVAKYFPDWDKHRAYGSNYRTAVTNIYRTKDDRFFHMHGTPSPASN